MAGSGVSSSDDVSFGAGVCLASEDRESMLSLGVMVATCPRRSSPSLSSSSSSIASCHWLIYVTRKRRYGLTYCPQILQSILQNFKHLALFAQPHLGVNPLGRSSDVLCIVLELSEGSTCKFEILKSHQVSTSLKSRRIRRLSIPTLLWLSGTRWCVGTARAQASDVTNSAAVAKEGMLVPWTWPRS